MIEEQLPLEFAKFHAGILWIFTTIRPKGCLLYTKFISNRRSKQLLVETYKDANIHYAVSMAGACISGNDSFMLCEAMWCAPADLLSWGITLHHRPFNDFENGDAARDAINNTILWYIESLNLKIYPLKRYKCNLCVHHCTYEYTNVMIQENEHQGV